MHLSEYEPISLFSERSYLDYAMYVIRDRALPSLKDGLKPVQRRILYAMSELGLDAQAKPKKSARTVGDVLGKFHPHGDSACYEAMVLMAQPFSYRYPLIEGQGNWGSSDDPKSFAAMRYTEAKLSRYAAMYLDEIGPATTVWTENFDGTLKEPRTLPVQIPTILLNGTTGIAVGMATDIPPHNLTEIVHACIHVLDHPECSLQDIMTHMPGPDFPTGAELITSADDLAKIYTQGVGTLKMRARYRVEENTLIIDALPYQVSGSKILEQMASLMQKKLLPMVDDLRDESCHEDPTRLVISFKRKETDPHQLMQHLFAQTDLEHTLRVNLNILGLDGKPRVMGLKEILSEWLVFREDTVRLRLEDQWQKMQDRLHLLEGFRIAYAHLETVIDLIRHADDPHEALKNRLLLSDAQVKGILEMRLRHLARLQEKAIDDEHAKLTTESQAIQEILSSRSKLKAFMKKELKHIIKTYGDARRTQMVERQEARPIETTALIEREAITVVLSQNAWIRQGKGHEIDGCSLSYKAGDGYACHVRCWNTESLGFVDSAGRVYSLPAHDLPNLRGYGDPVTTRLAPPSGVRFRGMWSTADRSVVFVTLSGYGFASTPEMLKTKIRAGKTCLKIEKDESFFISHHTADVDNLALALLTEEGALAILSLDTLPQMEKGKGLKLVALKKGKALQNVVLFEKNQSLRLKSGKRFLDLDQHDQEAYRIERGRSAVKLPRGYQSIQEISVLAERE